MSGKLLHEGDRARKMCGNCLMYDEGEAQCDYFVIEEGEEVHERRSPEDGACDDWEKLELSLEQRYQQLGQVAREMYDWAEGVTSRHYTIVPERVDGFRARLEALGVSLDG